MTPRVSLDTQDERRRAGEDEKQGLLGAGEPATAGNEAARAGEEETQEVVAALIRPCRIAIFLNIWSSIFTAAFFAYIKPSGSIDTELVVYFVRLFSDLVGRPLARLPRPHWVSTKDDVVRIAVLRMSLMFTFFCYIGIPWFPKNDAFVIILISVFSVLSGYLAVLSYEYAAASLKTKAGQSMSGAIMNSTFQMAAFSAVTMSLIISTSGILPDPGSEGGKIRSEVGEAGISSEDGLWPEEEGGYRRLLSRW